MSDQTDTKKRLKIETEMKRLGNEMRKFAKYLAEPDDTYIFCVDSSTIKIDMAVGVRGGRPTGPRARLIRKEIEWETLCKLLGDYEAIASRTRKQSPLTT